MCRTCKHCQHMSWECNRQTCLHGCINVSDATTSKMRQQMAAVPHCTGISLADMAPLRLSRHAAFKQAHLRAHNAAQALLVSQGSSAQTSCLQAPPTGECAPAHETYVRLWPKLGHHALLTSTSQGISCNKCTTCGAGAPDRAEHNPKTSSEEPPAHH